MTPQSAKAKGRTLQQWIRNRLIDVLGIKAEDIASRSMGAGGEDLMFSLAARSLFNYSLEAKNQEKVNVWSSYEQAVANTPAGVEPLLVIKRNLHKPLAIVDADYFIALHKARNPHGNR